MPDDRIIIGRDTLRTLAVLHTAVGAYLEAGFADADTTEKLEAVIAAHDAVPSVDVFFRDLAVEVPLPEVNLLDDAARTHIAAETYDPVDDGFAYPTPESDAEVRVFGGGS